MSVTDWGAPAAPQQDQQGWGVPPADGAAVPPSGVDAPDLNDTMDGGGVKSFSFDGPVGTTADGLIVEIPKGRQKTDFDSKLPLFWKANKLTTETVGDDGKPLAPAWTYPINIQTDQKVEDDDDGVRAIFFEYKKLEALKEARKASGAEKVEVGGRLMVRYMSGGPRERQRDPSQPRNKVYAVKYFPPGSAEARQLVGRPQQAAPPPPPPLAQPVPTAAQVQSWAGTEEPPF